MGVAKDNSNVGNEVGGAQQWPLTAAQHGLAATVAAAGNTLSPVIPSNGWQKISAAVTSSQTGALQIQRYLDAAGTIPQGAVSTVALVAATQSNLNVNDGLPFMSFTVKITNTGGATANLSGVAVLLQSA